MKTVPPCPPPLENFLRPSYRSALWGVGVFGCAGRLWPLVA